MKKMVTQWEPLEEEPKYHADLARIQPPGIGGEIGWVQDWRKPYLTVKIWRWLWQIGYVYD